MRIITCCSIFSFFFFNDSATTEIYTLSLHDALPISLAWFLHMIRRRSARWLRERTRLYRFIDFVGRWSNIDVFMVSILAASLQFGFLTTVDPEAGVVSFAAVVALTMLATAAFDPRLMW